MDKRMLAALDEAYLDQQVLGIAHENGWRAYHTRDSRKVVMGDTGYPDWTLARDGRVVFMECKTETGKLRPEQELWLQAVGWPGYELQWSMKVSEDLQVYVVRPSDWDERRIHAALK